MPSAVLGEWVGRVAGRDAAIGVARLPLDEAAASRLQIAASYRETYRSEPSWQGL